MRLWLGVNLILVTRRTQFTVALAPTSGTRRSLNSFGIMRKFIFFFAAGLLLVACKPSENNYKLAYDTARRVEREGLDDGVFELMQQEALPPMVRVMGDSVRIKRVNLKWYYTPAAVDSGKRIEPGAYNVAVSVFKMPTNAKAQADAIAAEGYRSCVMLNNGNNYYVIAGVAESLDSAAHLSSRYLSTHNSGYVGLTCPVALQPIR